jgi:hypothetical protein
LHDLGQVHGSDFQVVDVSSLMVSPDSGQAQQSTVTPPPPPPPPPTPISVMISPTQATVRINKNQLFTAAVQNSTNKAVTWKVNGITGGTAQYGYISSLGRYMAPSSVPGPAVTVTAVSVADPTKSASATVTVVRR